MVSLAASGLVCRERLLRCLVTRVALVRGAGVLGRWRGLAIVTAVAGFVFSIAVIAVSDLGLLKVQGWLFLASLPLFALVWWSGRKAGPDSSAQ